jgi:hypothetical protein
MRKSRRWISWAFVIALSAIGGVSGCGSTKYEYTIDVNSSATAHVTADTNPADVSEEAPAHVKVEWFHGQHTITVPGGEGAATMNATEYTFFMFAPIPSIRVTVTKDGYKSWQAIYRKDELVFSEGVYRRIDMIHLEPVASTEPSVLISGTPKSDGNWRDFFDN